MDLMCAAVCSMSPGDLHVLTKDHLVSVPDETEPVGEVPRGHV